MPDKSVTDLPLAFLWRDYRAADQGATAAYELCCSLNIEHCAARPQCPVAFTKGPPGRSIRIPLVSIEHGIAEANREWHAAIERLNRIRGAVAITPIRSHADAMIKARFLNDSIADTLGKPWDTVWWQLNDWLS